MTNETMAETIGKLCAEQELKWWMDQYGTLANAPGWNLGNCCGELLGSTDEEKAAFEQAMLGSSDEEKAAFEQAIVSAAAKVWNETIRIYWIREMIANAIDQSILRNERVHFEFSGTIEELIAICDTLGHEADYIRENAGSYSVFAGDFRLCVAFVESGTLCE